ncbi:type III pantothenate kinase [Caedibacter taeniospiralis]|uniref:type III pantothenate kinase n=1 Tax=Caedibacter taeniospiralis TaxID=28907 RepID=UPI000C27E866|nr:type III pantothenate kinase [Caedibacter taeniospiralis]
MLLTLDVGNSHIHAGVFNQNELILQFRYTTASAHGSSDQIGIFLRQALSENDIDPKAITGVAIASVVPAINYSLRSAILKYFQTEPFFLQPGVKTGLKMQVATPKEVGADRIAGCIAAVELFPNKDVLVIDLGTATVFDVVRKDKAYLSGAILPGVKISLEALSNNAAQLSSVSIVKPSIAIGKDTDTNLQSGIYYGHLGALKELKSVIIAELNVKAEEVITIATGGFSQLFNEKGLFDVIVPELVLQGIKIAFDKNR